jgi:negative modulator of initiation of replication
MNSIQIDDQVFAELARRATGFHVTPNDVLRRILDLSSPPSEQLAPPQPPPPPAPVSSTVTDFVRSERFQRHNQAVDRYLVILGWLHSAHSKQFAEAALKFHRGSRAYFAKSEKEILESGDNVTARQIPQSPFWTLTTLDNKSKRLVLEDVLRALGYSRGDINIVLAALPDSGIRRNHGSRLFAEFQK